MNTQTKPNGHDNHNNGNSNGQFHPLDGVISDTPADGAIMQLRTGLHAMGRNRALASGTTSPIQEDINSLADHARAMARETYCDTFDPAKHPHDKVRQGEYDNRLKDRAEAQQFAMHARANVRDAENDLARTPKAGEKPTPKPWLMPAFIIAITIGVAPTFHDLFFHTLPDDVLAWLVSLTPAAFVGAMLTLAILSGRRTIAHWIGVVGGVGIGIALGAIRLSAAENSGECVFAVGLTIFEIAAVLLLEWLASGLRDAEDKWIEVKKLEDEAIQLRDAATAELARWEARLEEIGRAIRDHIAYVEDRSTRNLQVTELEDVAVKAAVDGYNSGVAENLGRILGVRRTQ
ncbi:MAG: hypothetical protein ACHP7P_06700 [Terriglobales bacterium]